ncbi:MAG: glycosyltransferase family 9 protein [Phycisphaerae bacterium]|nr:glycosyltransferase family 9 protein [Phycisphaerae bacterium]
MATPALRALRRTFADARISLMMKPYVRDIVAGGNWADEIVFWRGGKSRRDRQRSFLGQVGELRRRKFDLAVLLTNSFRSALLATLIKAERRVGYDRDGRGMLLTDRLVAHRVNGKFVPVSMLRYYGALVDYLGCRPDCAKIELFTEPADEEAVDRLYAQHRINPDRPVIVVNSGAAFGSAKCWPPERFAAVADRLVEEFDAQIVVPCGPKELEIIQAIRHEMRHAAVFLDDPIIPLRHLKALVRRADLLLTNDTGPRHFACAFGKPLVTVFGPTDPAWTETDYALERKLIAPVDCGPCMKRRCATDHRCMTRVTTDAVFAACAELLRSGRQVEEPIGR